MKNINEDNKFKTKSNEVEETSLIKINNESIENIRNNIQEIIDNSLLSLVKNYGHCNSVDIERSYKEVLLNKSQSAIYMIFNKINQIREQYGVQAEQILGGEFNFGDIHGEIPLFVVLDFLLQLCCNKRNKVSESFSRFCEETIQYARNLPFNSPIQRDWHVNNRFIIGLHTWDANFSISTYESLKNVRNKQGSKKYYNSTIDAYENFISLHIMDGYKDKIYASSLNEDIEKYPELVADKIWYLSITNCSYDWGSWNLNSSTTTYILFKEQEEKLKKDYQQIKIDIEKKKVEDTRKGFNEIVNNYIQTITLDEFILREDVPWDEKPFDKMKTFLEDIYYDFCDYAKRNKNSNIESAMQDESFVRDIYFSVREVDYSEREAKKVLIEFLIKYYETQLNSMDRTKKEEISLKLNRLSVFDLLLYREKTKSKIFGRRFLLKAIK